MRSIESDCFGISSSRNNINSKKKGTHNELIACKSVTDWVGVKFVRTPMSGGLRRINTHNIVSDIIPDTLDTAFIWDYIIETKALKSITIKRFLSSSSHIFKIWEQCITDARRATKIPIALLRSNGMDKGDYYLILEAALGGQLMALAVPPLFSGSNHSHSLIGFLFSDIKRLCTFKQWDRVVRASNIINHSKITCL